jgi:hypothetical protein
MKCKQGDLAVIKFSVRPENIGRIVKVAESIGRYEKGTMFQYRGMPCQALITDHYWWIEADDLSIMLGPSPRAYIADSWLEPIKPDDKEKDLTAEDIEDKKFAMDLMLG